jgi:hypothetical protein
MNINTQRFALPRGTVNKIAKRFPWLILSASLLALAIFLSLSKSAPAQMQDIQVIEITAKK